MAYFLFGIIIWSVFSDGDISILCFLFCDVCIVQYFLSSGTNVYLVKFVVCLFLLIYPQAGTRQELYWAINAEPTYCGSLLTLV